MSNISCQGGVIKIKFVYDVQYIVGFIVSNISCKGGVIKISLSLISCL